MAVNTSQTKYFQNIGVGADQLRFSEIANTMGLDGASNVRFGDYRRKTGANEIFADVDGTPDEKSAATAIVPDSEENRNCGVDATGISEANNHKVSSLKNMIKRFDVSYSGGATSQRTLHPGGNVISNSTNWDENLDLNIPKRLTIDGSSYKASSTSEHALKFNAAALNLELKFNGTQVTGKEGAGGSSGGGNGGAGGSALYLRNNTAKSNGNGSIIKLDVSNNSFIAGGGGGGGGGFSGNVSGTTHCTVTNSVRNNHGGWSHSCPSGCRPCSQGPGGQYMRGRAGYARGHIYYNGWHAHCSSSTTNQGNTPSQRIGGPGGAGQGSNRTTAQGGGAGTGAAYGNCNSGNRNSHATANAGAAGASGGNFGTAGGNASGNGGAKGRWLNVSTTRWQHIGSDSNSILKGGVQ